MCGVWCLVAIATPLYSVTRKLLNYVSQKKLEHKTTSINYLVYVDNKWKEERVLNINSLTSTVASRNEDIVVDSVHSNDLPSSDNSFQDSTEQEWNQPCSDLSSLEGNLSDSGSHDSKASEQAVGHQLQELIIANRQLLVAQEAAKVEKMQLQISLQEYQTTINMLQNEKRQLKIKNEALEKQLRQCREDRDNIECILHETISSCQNTIDISQQILY